MELPKEHDEAEIGVDMTPTASTSCDHDYCEEVVASNSKRNLKRKLEFQSSKPSKNISSRQNHGLKMLSSETLLSLKQINENTNNMA